MALALIVASFVSIFALGYASWGGWHISAGAVNVTQHILRALPATVISIFAHSMAMFYFIGTGVQIKDAVRAKGLPLEFIEETKLFKKKVFPAAMYTMILVMVTFILGGGVHTKVIHRYVHLGMASGCIALSVWAFIMETRYIMENLFLAEKVADASRDAAAIPPGKDGRAA